MRYLSTGDSRDAEYLYPNRMELTFVALRHLRAVSC